MAVKTIEPVFIKPKDLFLFFTWIKTPAGVCLKYRKMRQELEKEKKQWITIPEFAEYADLSVEFVMQKLTQ